MWVLPRKTVENMIISDETARWALDLCGKIRKNDDTLPALAVSCFAMLDGYNFNEVMKRQIEEGTPITKQKYLDEYKKVEDAYQHKNDTLIGFSYLV